MNNEIMTIGGGCFWCLEAAYKRLEGVLRAQSGYAGGSSSNPTYEQVCKGVGGHAEVVQIEFDTRITFLELLEIFWQIHDPTTPNRQGADVGIQYRSIILHHTERQRQEAIESQKQRQRKYNKPIVTQLQPFTTFYPAEKYHDNYFDDHPGAPYCIAVIRPKLRKLNLKF